MARAEWQLIRARFPAEARRLLGHFYLVEAARSLSSRPLAQAMLITANSGPSLYWWATAGIGAVYRYDGANLGVVLVGSTYSTPLPRLITTAQARI